MRLVKGLVGLMVRLAWLPFRLGFALLGGSFKVGLKVGAAPVRVGWRATRAAGFTGVACFVLGLVIGLLFAPAKGRELRAKLQQRLSGGAGPTDAELAELVAFELGHAPRTWHLPQPEVSVVAGRVRLVGPVPDEAARTELVGVVAAIPGVAAVDDLLAVEGPSEAPAG